MVTSSALPPLLVSLSERVSQAIRNERFEASCVQAIRNQCPRPPADRYEPGGSGNTVAQSSFMLTTLMP